MSFEIEPSEGFLSTFHDALSFSAQEAVLDLLEMMRENPGQLLDRDAVTGSHLPVTTPLQIESESGPMVVRILFQYDADETTIYLHEIVIVPGPF